MTLGEGHYQPLGQGQQLCEIWGGGINIAIRFFFCVLTPLVLVTKALGDRHTDQLSNIPHFL